MIPWSASRLWAISSPTTYDGRVYVRIMRNDNASTNVNQCGQRDALRSLRLLTIRVWHVRCHCARPSNNLHRANADNADTTRPTSDLHQLGALFPSHGS